MVKPRQPSYWRGFLMSTQRPDGRQPADVLLSLFHPVLEGEVGWSARVVTRQGPSSLAW